MYLMYYTEEGKRVYTLKKVTPGSVPTESAHPARFSPDDKYRCAESRRVLATLFVFPPPHALSPRC